MSSDESDDDDDDEMVIVIDNGSSMTKAGFAGDKTVSCHMPTVYGKVHPGFEACDETFYIGDEACEQRGRVSLQYPIERGIIQDFDVMEKVWHHIIYNELRVNDDQEFSMLVTEPPTNMASKREKIAQIMFETFNASTLKIAVQHELSLIASCRTTGVIIDSGDGATNIICIHNGKIIQESLVHLPFGGRDLNDFLSKSLTQSGKGKDMMNECVDVARIKHEVCYIPIDYNEEIKKFSHTKQYKTYKTPRGNSIKIEEECFQCPEILFQPSIIQKEFNGIHHATYDSILKCPADIHAELYNNIIFAGGNTIFRGIQERMKKEMCMLAPSGVIVYVIAPPERLKSVWLGGSIMGSVNMFLKDFITKDAYDEHGPIIVSHGI